MRNRCILFILSIFLLCFAGWTFAQEKAKVEKKPEAGKAGEAVKPPEEVRPEAAKKESPPPPVKYRLGGIVTAIDPSAERITLHQNQVKRERTVALTIGPGASKKLPGLKVGDAINVWVTGKTITALEEVG